MNNDKTAQHDVVAVTCNGSVLCGSNQNSVKTLNIYTSLRRPLYGDITVNVPFDDRILYNLVGGSSIKIMLANTETMASGHDITIYAIITSVRIINRIEPTTSSSQGSGHSDVTIQFVGGCNSIPYHLSVIQSAIITDKIGSSDAIKKVCSVCEVPFNIKGKLSTSDSMKWIIANKNLVQSVEHISDRSYISDKDIMLAWFDESTSVNVASLSWLISNPVGKLTYVPVNGATYIYEKEMYFSNMVRTDGIGARSMVFGSNIVKNVSVSSNSISVSSTTKINQTSTISSSGMLNVTEYANDKLNYSNLDVAYTSPNTHSNYYKCKQVRGAIMANMGKFMMATTRISSQFSVGDVVTVGDTDGKTLPRLAAGNYLICDKNYVLSNGVCTQVLVMAKDSIPSTSTVVSVDKANVK